LVSSILMYPYSVHTYGTSIFSLKNKYVYLSVPTFLPTKNITKYYSNGQQMSSIVFGSIVLSFPYPIFMVGCQVPPWPLYNQHESLAQFLRIFSQFILFYFIFIYSSLCRYLALFIKDFNRLSWVDSRIRKNFCLDPAKSGKKWDNQLFIIADNWILLFLCFCIVMSVADPAMENLFWNFTFANLPTKEQNARFQT